MHRSALLPVMLGMLLVMIASSTTARELRIDPDELIEVELAGVGISARAGAPLVLLRHLETGDVVPIIVGVEQARSILAAQHGSEPPRPMTHDLAVRIIEELGGRLERVLVDDLVDNTFLGMLELSSPGQEGPVRIDSRPSDALALAVRTGASIHVAPAVLVAGEDLDYEGLPDQQVVTALGITVVEADPATRSDLGLPDEDGVLVRRLTGAAADSGLHPGAFITRVNETSIDSPMAFLEAVRDTPQGTTVVIEFWHEGDTETVEIDAGAGRREREGPMISV